MGLVKKANCLGTLGDGMRCVQNLKSLTALFASLSGTGRQNRGTGRPWTYGGPGMHCKYFF